MIGNRADDGFLWLWQRVFERAVPLWAALAVVAVVALVAGGFAIWWRQQAEQVSLALRRADAWLDVDEWLLTRFADLIDAIDRKRQVEQLLEAFVGIVEPLFADKVLRASILRMVSAPPMGEAPAVLRLWVGHQLRRTNITGDRVFFTRPELPGHRRSVAGAAFVSGAAQIARMRREGSGWVCDHPEYIEFSNDPSRTPLYRSFVAVPLHWEESTEPIGVLCLDSAYVDAFDGEQSGALLEWLGQRLAAIVAFYDHWEASSRRGQ